MSGNVPHVGLVYELKNKIMKTEIRIIAEMTDEQCEVLLSEFINTSEIIGIKLELIDIYLKQYKI